MQSNLRHRNSLMIGASNVNNCFNPWIFTPRVEIILYNKYINYFSPYVNYKIRWSSKHKHQRRGTTSPVWVWRTLQYGTRVRSRWISLVCSERKKSCGGWVHRQGLISLSYLSLTENLFVRCGQVFFVFYFFYIKSARYH